MSNREAGFVRGLAVRVDEILARCSGCGRCVEACPTAGPAGIDRSEPGRIVAEVLAILRGDGDPESRGARWAETCTGSGACLTACEDGVNPRFMLGMTRLALSRAKPDTERSAAGRQAFGTMSRAVKVLSRLQVPPAFVARITRPAGAARPAPEPAAPPEVVMYLGCNVLRTPHIALLCLDALDRIGATYEVLGGPANCCGILQLRAGDATGAGEIGGKTLAAFAATGAPRVLTWCPTCTLQFGETLMPTVGAGFALEHVTIYLAERLDRLTPHFVRRVERRVALHEHPGVAGVTEAVLRILRAVPGLEVVDLEQPRVGYMCNSLAPVAPYKRELHARELAAAEAAGVQTLVGVYHACHRELCAHEAARPFRIANFLELVGEAMGVERLDLFKHWKMMQDVERVLADLGDRPEIAGLDLETVREVIVAHILGEQPLPLGRSFAE